MTRRIIQIYRGTSAQNDAFTGSAGELTMDTTNNELRIHDGSTQGGHKIGKGYRPSLFDFKWADHLVNDPQWLRGDTFSWQDGGVYEAAYNHLVDDIDGKSLTSETIGTTTIQFYLADDGHKICPASEASNVADIFTATGVAWYYILDIVNQRFKLPRAKALNGAIVGNGKTIGLTDGTNNYGLTTYLNGNGDILSNSRSSDAYNKSLPGKATSNTSISNKTYLGLTTDSAKSGIIAERDNTDQHKYLYFYVGNFTQTALENTAGLNASLFNDKADIDLSNVPANIGSTAKAYFTQIGMPSTTYDSLTLGASGSSYQAPADGYFYMKVTTTTSSPYTRMYSANSIGSFAGFYGTASGIHCFLPVKKGTSATVEYGGTGWSLYFVYAQGAA